MNFQKDLSEYVKSQREHNQRDNLPHRIRISNLEGKCTDRMLKRHRESKELLVISHLGWNSRLEDSITLNMLIERFHSKEQIGTITNRRRIELIKLMNALGGQFNNLRNEVLLEQALNEATKRDIPTILTIPTQLPVPYSEHSNQKLEKFTKKAKRDNWDIIKTFKAMLKKDALEGHFFAPDTNYRYLDYIQSLIKGRENVYLLPTFRNRGEIITDDCGEKDVYESIASYISNNLKVVEVVDGRPIFKLFKPEERSISDFGKSPFPMIANYSFIEKLGRNNLSKEETKAALDLLGEPLFKEIKDEFRKLFVSHHNHWAWLLTQEAVASPLLEPILCNRWENVHIMGGYINGCMSGTLRYFSLSEVENITFHTSYCFPRNEEKIVLSEEEANRLVSLGYDLMNHQKEEKAKKEMVSILFNHSDNKNILDELGLIYYWFNNTRNLFRNQLSTEPKVLINQGLF